MRTAKRRSFRLQLVEGRAGDLGARLHAGARAADTDLGVRRGTPGGGFLAHFGYDNPNPKITVSVRERVRPVVGEWSAATLFEPGRVEDAFQVQSGGEPLTWRLTGNEVTATASSNAVRRVDHDHEDPQSEDDPGRFNLEIDGETAGGAASVGDGDNTGTVAVNAGQHTVGESAARTPTCPTMTCKSRAPAARASSVRAADRAERDHQERASDRVRDHEHEQGRETDQPCPGVRRLPERSPERCGLGLLEPKQLPGHDPHRSRERVRSGAADRGQPLVFQPGRLVGALQTPFAGASTLAWTVGRTTVTASSSSTRCTPTLELRKVTVPATIPASSTCRSMGRRGRSAATARRPGRSRLESGKEPSARPRGREPISPTTTRPSPAAGTALSKCRRRARSRWRGRSGRRRRLHLHQHPQANRAAARASQPPPPQPPLPPPPAPSPPLGDLSVVKTAAPATAVLGQTIRWQVTVTNRSTLAAADGRCGAHLRADLSREDHRDQTVAGNLQRRRLQPRPPPTRSQRHHHRPRESDRHRPGAERRPGQLRGTRVELPEQHAAALVRVTAPIKEAAASAVKGVAVSRACSTVVAQPRTLQVSRTSIVLTTARNRYGKPLRSLTVRALGPGINEQARTDSRGIARFALTPRQRGLVYFQHGVRLLPAGVRSRCRTLLAVLGTTATEPVTG